MADYNSVHTGLNVDDAVAEVYGNNGIVSGNDGNGNFWTKYPDGTMHQWGTKSYFDVDMTTVYGSLYTSEVIPGNSYPVPFIGEMPSVTASAFTSINCWLHLYDDGTLSVAPGFRAIKGTNSACDVTLSWQAFGKWKEPSSNIILSPASGVIESGENAEGTYIKFPDGTLQCFGYESAVANGATTTFPFEFISIPIVLATVNVNVPRSVTTLNITTTGVDFLKWTDTGGASATPVHYQAIGRWK